MANIISLLSDAFTMPSGVWEGIIGWVYSFIGNYGWTVLLVSLVVKLALSPLDFFNRKATLKNTAIQGKVNKELDVWKEKHKKDEGKPEYKQMLNQKQMELFKKNGSSPFGMCGILIVYMGITLVVFLTLFSAMTNISNSMVVQQYDTYEKTYTEYLDEHPLDIEGANKAVVKKYNETKFSWLWIENLWVSDTNANPIASYDSYKNIAKKQGRKEADLATEAQYELVMGPIRNSVRSNNGYYILIILAGVTSVASALVAKQSQKKKKKPEEQQEKVPEGRILSAEGKREGATPTATANKLSNILIFVLPAIMVLITLGYSAAFAIYIVTMSVVSTLTTLLFNNIINKMDKNKTTKVEETKRLANLPEYSR